jgi:sugar phosphate isomerase/epimerase
MPVRFGISPICWSNDDLPELGGGTPLETCLSEARLAGFEGIELGNKFPRDPAVLRPMLERYGLSLISGWYSGRLLERSVREELAAIEAHRGMLVANGPCRAGLCGDERQHRRRSVPPAVPAGRASATAASTISPAGLPSLPSACCGAACASPITTIWGRWSRARPKSTA